MASPVRALFVSDRHDAPYRYRCIQACAQVRAAGGVANVLRPDDPRTLASVSAYSVVVLFRLPWSPHVEGIAEAARRDGIPLVFDCDDLVFDSSAAELMPFRAEYSEAEWEESYGAHMRALRRTFDACDWFLGSTPALAEAASSLGKPAHTHPNVVPDEYLGLAPVLRRLRRRSRPLRTVGYFSGSNTHDRDLESIAPTLRRLLSERRDARLILGGHIDVGRELPGLERRMVRLPHVSFRALAWAYAACDVAIAPSAVSNAFTDGKSALKFFEPGVFGVPIVASPTREMRSAIEHGVSGWLAGSDEEWAASLEQALDGEVSLKVGGAARRAVERSHTSRALAGRLADLLGKIGSPPVGKSPALLPFRGEEYGGRLDLVSRSFASARRAREVLEIRSRLSDTPGMGPTPEDVHALVEQVLDGSAVPGDGVAVLVAGSPSRSGWAAGSEIEAEAGPFGESTLTGPDPHWVSPWIDLHGGGYRYALIRMRVSAGARAGRAQLLWHTERQGGFSERQSESFAVDLSGADTTYVVDLVQLSRSRPGRARFRLDPLDRPGSARVLVVALLAEDWRPAERTEGARAEPAVRLDRRARSTLAEATRALAVGEARWFETSREVTKARELLGRLLASSGCEVVRLEETSTGSRALVRRASAPVRRGVDIVVPVHNAREQTSRCLRSVLRHARGDYRLVVIDDASTDPELYPELERLSRRHERVVLLRNAENLGFVGTCNRAFALSGGRDVLLLNSDTQVFRGFLGRLRAAARADERTGIACPLSNNATILSVPELGRSNELPEGISRKQMAALVRKVSRRRRPEIVTPVGFCMYIRAEVLESIGHFDAERFGRGFGEENDFGERAKAAGWKIRAADDVYVWHEGKASFGDAGYALESTNAKVLEARQPGYHAAVAEFVRDNPLAPIQDQLRWLLRRHPCSTEPAVLMLLQASPFAEPCGGTEYVTRDLVRALRHPRVVLAWPGDHRVEVAEVIGGELDAASFHAFPLERSVARFSHDHAEARRLFAELLELFRVAHVHVHHLMGWPLALREELERAGVPYTMTVHDFYAVCPSQNLLDFSSLKTCCPSGCADPEQTTRCLRALFHELDLPAPADPPAFLGAHRAAFEQWLSGAQQIFYPSVSARSLVESVYPGIVQRGSVLPHPYLPTPGVSQPRRGSETDVLRVALIGEVSYASKGREGYLELMQELRREPIEWHIFGRTDRFDFQQRIEALGSIRLRSHGGYAREQIVGLLRDAKIDVGVLLPIWPETFSLTLSELLGAGVPVIASRQGALEDRLEGAGYAALVGSPTEAAAELRDLCHNRERLRSMTDALRALERPDVEAWAEAQARIYREHTATRKPESQRRREIRRLAETRVSVVPSRPAVSTVQPSARYRAAGWYRRAEQLKPLLPETVRALVRRRIGDDGSRVVQRFRLPSARARAAADVRLDARYLTTARFTSLGEEPSFVLSPTPISPGEVGALRFNLWCSHHGRTFARVYWRHEGDSRLRDDKSVTIELNGGLGDWQEYVVRLDRATHPKWYAGDKIVELRFQPVNYAGLFCVGRFELCEA